MTHQIINLLFGHDVWFWLLQLGCIAIWKPKGVNIAKRYLYNSFSNNSEGAGFAYVENGKIEIKKGFFNFKTFWKTFRDYQKFPALIHFRIATHGDINPENCHPFPMLDGKYAIVHNGVLPSGLHSGKKTESDTKQFADLLSTVIEMVPFGHPGFTTFLEEAIGYNKIAVMRNDGEVWMLNPGMGEWHNGSWYSNRTYIYSRSSYTYKPKKISTGDSTADMWHRLGYGSKDEPYWSSARGELGWYDSNGVWCKVEDPDQTEITDEELERFNAMSDEDIQNLSEKELAEIEGDLAFAPNPESEQERFVARWLATKKAKVRRSTNSVLTDEYHPHPFVRGQKLLTNVVEMPVC